MSTEPTVPPRPDHLHPVPAAPPQPGEETPRREGATWSWVEGVGVYVVAFLIAGMLSLPVLNAFDEDSDLANMTATVVAALVIVGILIGWLSMYHRGWVGVMRLPERGFRTEVLPYVPPRTHPRAPAHCGGRTPMVRREHG